MMKRRNFLKILGIGTAVPVVAKAQILGNQIGTIKFNGNITAENDCKNDMTMMYGHINQRDILEDASSDGIMFKYKGLGHWEEVRK